MNGSQSDKPSVLFLCVHNAGRSQMAAGWLRHLGGDRISVYSGGSEPAERINPAAVAAMAEVGIDITEEFPKPWTDEIVRAADVVVTMPTSASSINCASTRRSRPTPRSFPRW